MLVFSFFQNAAKVLHPTIPCEKCVQKRAFVAKFGYLWRNSGFFVAKFGFFDRVCVNFYAETARERDKMGPSLMFL
jgi:hypothetical protein